MLPPDLFPDEVTLSDSEIEEATRLHLALFHAPDRATFERAIIEFSTTSANVREGIQRWVFMEQLADAVPPST